MKPPSQRRMQWILLCILLCAPVVLTSQTPKPVAAPDSTQTDGELKFAVIVTRHGVRSPTGKLEQLNQYSRQPWPLWSVPPGYLTEHGAKLMTIFGAYDRELLSSQGLLAPSGCVDAERIRIVADSDQRTRETGKALAAGLAPECAIELRAFPEGTNDPIFHYSAAKLSEADKLEATASVSGRIGANPQGLTEVYRTKIEELERVLNACKPEPACLNDKAPLSLFDVPTSLTPGKSDHLVELHSPLSLAASMSESLMLEYTEGMDAANVGWGRVDRKKLDDLLEIHTASSDIAQRTPFVARAQSSNLLYHVLQSMQQTTTANPIPGALSKPDARLLILVGHDTNIATMSGALGLNWVIDGRRDDTPPGGALVFEMWKQHNSGDYRVRVYYTAQTLDQMRNTTPLSLQNPPERVPVFVPGCSQADYSCSWKEFEQVIENARISTFVQ